MKDKKGLRKNKYQLLCTDQRCNACQQKNKQVQALDDVADHYHLQSNWNLFYDLRLNFHFSDPVEKGNMKLAMVTNK